MALGLRKIRDRRAQIGRELAILDGQVAVLRAEDDRLAIAEEVIITYEGDEPEPKDATRSRGRKGAARASGKTKVPQKPEGVPPMPEMIIAALRDAQERGLPGLEPKAIRDFIRDKWWPDVVQNAVGPIVWRLATKDGKIDKVDELYALKVEAVSADSPATTATAAIVAPTATTQTPTPAAVPLPVAVATPSPAAATPTPLPQPVAPLVQVTPPIQPTAQAAPAAVGIQNAPATGPIPLPGGPVAGGADAVASGGLSANAPAAAGEVGGT
jgi:hypothetical protein